jgi:eight-cysteine-cluster-containing protein
MKNVKNIDAILLGGALILAAGLAVFVWITMQPRSAPSDYLITNFEECAAAGNAVMESYPRQCRANGQTFTEIVDGPIPVEPDGGIGDTPSGGCMPAGCSGQVCADAAEADGLVTDCMFRAEYACYRSAKCERQTNGKCGWTQTTALKNCLANPPSLE